MCQYIEASNKINFQGISIIIMRKANRIQRTPRQILTVVLKPEINDKLETESPSLQNDQETFCQQAQYSLLLDQLQEIINANHYQEGYFLEMLFTEPIKNHLRFIGYQPHSLTVVGTNLLQSGQFHRLWWMVISKQQFIKKDVLKPGYYKEFRNLIKQSLASFESIFLEDKQNIEQQVKSSTIIQSVENLGMISNNSEPQPLPLMTNQIDKNYSHQNKSIFSNVSDEASQSQVSYSHKLLMDGHNNMSVISAELVCLFLKIPEQRIFQLQNVEIVRVHENYHERQFQLALVTARVPECSQPKVCIICYKMYNFEQLLRIQNGYGSIYGLITYDSRIDIYQFLQDEINTNIKSIIS